MKVLIQRVSSAQVTVQSNLVGSIDHGLLVFMGVEAEDTREDLDYIVRKVIGLRIFEDEAGKMNLDLKQVNGSILVVSQFTLVADTRKGNRPSFNQAADPDKGYEYYERFIKAFKELDFRVHSGQFGAQMNVNLINDGPVTIWIDSKDRIRSRR